MVKIKQKMAKIRKKMAKIKKSTKIGNSYWKKQKKEQGRLKRKNGMQLKKCKKWRIYPIEKEIENQIKLKNKKMQI